MSSGKYDHRPTIHRLHQSPSASPAGLQVLQRTASILGCTQSIDLLPEPREAENCCVLGPTVRKLAVQGQRSRRNGAGAPTLQAAFQLRPSQSTQDMPGGSEGRTPCSMPDVTVIIDLAVMRGAQRLPRGCQRGLHGCLSHRYTTCTTSWNAFRRPLIIYPPTMKWSKIRRQMARR